MVYRFFAKQKCGILDLNVGLRFCLFGTVSLVAFYLFYNSLSDLYGFPFKLTFIPIYFGVSYFVFVLLGWMKKEDLNFLKTLANVKKLRSYVKDEISDQVQW